MKPLRILQLATAGPLYGAERWILALMNDLDTARADCRLAVLDDLPDGEPPLLTAARAAGHAATAIPCRGRFDPGAVARLRRLCREQRIDVVHSHGYKADLATLLATAGLPVRTVATPHGWSEKVDWKLRLYEALDRASFAAFDAVVPLSPELRDGLAANPLLGRRLHYIANGIDLAEIAATPTTRREAAGPVIGYCGQLIDRKNVATLIAAFAAWHRPDATLLLIGDGDRRAELAMQAQALGIAGQVRFTGYTPDRLAWMRGCDAFVLPSLREGIPRCLMEAMALGVPVIASAIPGNAEIVAHGETGLLFPPGDAEALTACLAATIADRDAGATRAAAARARIEQRHSGRAMALAYQDLFENLAHRPAPRRERFSEKVDAPRGFEPR